MSHADPHDPVVRARAGVRRARWPALLAGAGGAITVGVLGAAGLAPLLAGVGLGTLVAGPAVEWLTSMGMNALAGWLGNLAVDGLRAPFLTAEPDAPPDPAWLAEVGRRLDEAAAADAALAAELARMLAKIDAVPGALESIAEELGAQSDVILAQYDLLRQLQADVARLGLAGGALEPALVAEADRVIAAIVARADRSDAKLDQVLAGLTALRDEQRQALVSISGQTGDVRIGDVSAGDIHKPVMAPGSIYAPGGTVVQPFTPRRVEASPEELAESAARLATLPTDTVPQPQDVLPPGSWMGGLSRNQQFVGREADLLALASLLKGSQSVAVSEGRSAVASGLGGIGKTQLAVEFAYRYGRHFAGVFWLSFAQPDTVATEFARLGGAAHLQLFAEASGLSLDDQVRYVRSRLACGLPYLLIFDTARTHSWCATTTPAGQRGR